MSIADPYTAWLASPFGQVHAQAEKAAADRPAVEAAQTLAHFESHPACRWEIDYMSRTGQTKRNNRQIDMAVRCQPGWWDRIQGGAVGDEVNKTIHVPQPSMVILTGDQLITKPHNQFFWHEGLFVGSIQVSTQPHEPRPLESRTQTKPISWDEEALVRLANTYLLERERRKHAGYRPLPLGAAFYQYLNRQMKQRKADSTLYWVADTLKRLGIIEPIAEREHAVTHPA